jgi:hypothetical protein
MPTAQDLLASTAHWMATVRAPETARDDINYAP